MPQEKYRVLYKRMKELVVLASGLGEADKLAKLNCPKGYEIHDIETLEDIEKRIQLHKLNKKK